MSVRKSKSDDLLFCLVTLLAQGQGKRMAAGYARQSARAGCRASHDWRCEPPIPRACNQFEILGNLSLVELHLTVRLNTNSISSTMGNPQALSTSPGSSAHAGASKAAKGLPRLHQHLRHVVSRALQHEIHELRRMLRSRPDRGRPFDKVISGR